MSPQKSWSPSDKSRASGHVTPNDERTPFALITKDRHGLEISALNEAAIKGGIVKGMRLTDARALLPPLSVRQAEPHLKSASEMHRLFKGFEAAIERQEEILNACEFSLDELAYDYPDEPIPHGKSPQTHLVDLTNSIDAIHPNRKNRSRPPP